MRTRLLLIMSLCIITGTCPAGEAAGKYFAKKTYVPAPLPQYDRLRTGLPSPIFDEDTLLVRTYWKAWELAFRHFYEPAPGSGFVSQFIDAAFNANIFLWDTSFMTMFCNYAHGLVPGIGSLDNFYAKQHEDGEICREIVRATGIDFGPWRNLEDKPLFTRWGYNEADTFTTSVVPYIGRDTPSPNPKHTLDAMNNPMLSWAELESYRLTGDTARLALVYEPLVRYYRSLQKYLRQGNGLYVTDWAGMDNSPRNIFLKGGGQGVDISAQMVMNARDIAAIARILRRPDDAATYAREADELAALINGAMWDAGKKFYYDLTAEGTRVPVKTIGAYWTMLSHTASAEQAAVLAAMLMDTATFGRLHPVPTCAADEPDYRGTGGYWKGAVWAPTNTMVIRGLERYGYDELAREIAMKHVRIVAAVFGTTGTIWENYAPDAAAPGRHTSGALVQRDFVGWSAIGPIMYFLEYGIGLRADAPSNTLTWTIHSARRSGCERFRFNGHIVSLVAEPNGNTTTVRVSADAPFTLRVRCGIVTEEISVESGDHTYIIKG